MPDRCLPEGNQEGTKDPVDSPVGMVGGSRKMGGGREEWGAEREPFFGDGRSTDCIRKTKRNNVYIQILSPLSYLLWSEY